MGSFDGAENFESLYFLNHLSTIIDIEYIGLYRDDGLVIIKKTSKFNICKIKKKQITRNLSDIGVNTTINSGETS